MRRRSEPTRIRRPSARSLTIGLIVALLAVTVGGAAVRVADAVDILRSAEADIETASEMLKDGRLGPARDRLVAAEAALTEVSETLHTAPELTALGLLPVVSQNLTSIRESIRVATTVVHGGRLILATADDLQGPDGSLEVAVDEGQVDVDTLQAARVHIDDLYVQLTVDAQRSASPLLFPATRELRDAVFDEADEQRIALDRLQRGLTILDELLGVTRPARTLLAVANTAEMRGAGGMMLNYGVLDGQGGGADLVEFGRVEELQVNVPVEPDSVGLPEDFTARWDGFDPTREWRNATLSGDFTLTAPALLAMYQRASGVGADGVIQVDPQALAAILSVVGPVVVDEVGIVDAGNVVDLVLNEAYRLFPGVEERSDVLGDVAEAAFTALTEGDYPSVRDLASALVDAVDGRHLMMYSADGSVRSAVGYYGADGALPPPDAGDYLHLTAQNLSGNKLDYYVDTDVEFTGTREVGAVGEVAITIRVINDAPVGETDPPYIFGPFDGDQTAGVYRSAVSLYLPTGATLLEATGTGFRADPTARTENGRPLVGYRIDVPAGGEHVTELRLRLPPRDDADYRLDLIPSPRVRPTTVSVDLDLGEGAAARSDVVLDVPYAVGPSGATAVRGF